MTIRQTVIFVASTVSDIPNLLLGIDPDAEVVLLKSDSDAIEQMAQALVGRSGLAAIHLISHGSAGELQLGNATLNSANLNSYALLLAQIGQSLSAEGDLLLYGCQVGAGETGQSFIESIARITGADVAASNDLTGSTALGENWVLEAASGDIQTHQIAVPGFDAVLAPSGSPVFDFEGPTTDSGSEVTFANSSGHTLSVSVPSVPATVNVATDSTAYLSASVEIGGAIHLHFDGAATFDATSLEPVRNFVCEAYHSPKGVSCPAKSTRPHLAASRHCRKFQPNCLKSSFPGPSPKSSLKTSSRISRKHS